MLLTKNYNIKCITLYYVQFCLFINYNICHVENLEDNASKALY